MTVRSNYDDTGDPASGSRDVDKFYAADAQEHAQQINANTAARSSAGLYSALPAAGNVGALYFATDNGWLLRDNGTSWDAYVDGQPITPPPTTGWTDVNLGTDTVVADLGAQLMTVAARSGLGNWALRVRTLSPASNYTAEFRLDYTPPISSTQGSFYGFGVVLRESSSGKIVTFAVGDNSSGNSLIALSVTSWNGPTGSSSSIYTDEEPVAYFPNWWRIRDDGTNRYFEYSLNRLEWITALSHGRTTFITPDQIGFAVWNVGTLPTIKCRVPSLSIA